jgi:uncharacterized SAM-binding protein YcdF (DUF218 family)
MDLIRFILEPGNLLAALIVIAAVLAFTPLRRLARWVMAVAAGVMLIIAVSPIPSLLVTVLENRFQPTPPPDHVDGILVLGGALRLSVSRGRAGPALAEASERLFVMTELIHRYPNTKIIYCGGKESKFVKSLLSSIGTDLQNVSFDDHSSNTRENAVFARALVSPKSPNDVWLLVTSAYHMPRAVGVFRAQGWNVVPYPVDYQTEGDYELELHFDFYRGLQLTQIAVTEWIGLLLYHLIGWTADLYPGSQ